MTQDKREKDIAAIRSLVQDVTGQDVRTIGLPGGTGRPVYRVRTENHSVIVVQRNATPALKRERLILDRLAAAGAQTPRILARKDPMTVLSDLGRNRLNVALHQRTPTQANDLLKAAFASLVDLSAAAQTIDWSDILHPIDAKRRDLRHFVRGPLRLAILYGLPAPVIDVDRLQALLTVTTPTFVKWDSRCANATLDDQGKIGWFDFELSGLRQGFEDFAWLVTDETLPTDMIPIYDDLVASVRKAQPANSIASPDQWQHQFEVFATLQAGLRLRVVRNELTKKSWTAPAEILKYDLVGADPFMAGRLAATGAFLAARHQETANLVASFDQVRDIFDRAGRGETVATPR